MSVVIIFVVYFFLILVSSRVRVLNGPTFLLLNHPLVFLHYKRERNDFSFAPLNAVVRHIRESDSRVTDLVLICQHHYNMVEVWWGLGSLVYVGGLTSL